MHFRAERAGGGPSRTADAGAEAARHTADDSAGHVFVACSGPPDSRWTDKSIAAAGAVAAGTTARAASAGDRRAARNSRAGSGSRCAGCAAVSDWTAGTDAIAASAAWTAIAIAAGHRSGRGDISAGDGGGSGAPAIAANRSGKLLAADAEADRRLLA